MSSEATLTAEIRQTTLEQLGELLAANYIFPETAEQLQGQLRAQQLAGAYDSITEAVLFAQALTSDLQEVAHDKHLRVFYDPRQAEALQNRGAARQPSPEELRRHMVEASYNNFGFAKVERLLGNIGYLDLRGFLPAEWGGSTAVAAMNFLAHSSALIFDLRRNGGGAPSMIQLLTSYLFDEFPRHLNTFHFRPADSTQQFWTLPYVPGQRLPTLPIYVLSSAFTFSAAEEFTYNLKAMERATIVGEKTGGGAHPVSGFPVGTGFVVTIPTGRAVNPLTHSNWEGTGIEPHIAVPAEKALETAHLHALDQLISLSSDAERSQQLQWEREIAQAHYTPVPIEAASLEHYVGTYGDHQISCDDRGLLHSFRGLTERPLPLSTTRFAVNNMLKIEFVATDGPASALRVLFFNGQELLLPRKEERT